MQDHFRARVLFPIHDVNGAAVGFGGRVMPDGDGPKYKNSFDSTIYNKSRLLYGLHLAKDEIVRMDESIVCEGYTDVIGFADVGIERSVATCGTSLTEDHIRMLKRFGRRIVLAFDADAAGQAAAERIYEWERALEVDVAVAKLPDGVDPADLAAKDPDALRAAIADAVPFLGFRLGRALAGGAELAVAVVAVASIVAQDAPTTDTACQATQVGARYCPGAPGGLIELLPRHGQLRLAVIRRSATLRPWLPKGSRRSRIRQYPSWGANAARMPSSAGLSARRRECQNRRVS